MPITTGLGYWATVKEATDYYKCTRAYIHRLMRKGLLGECQKLDSPRGEYWMIPYPFPRGIVREKTTKEKVKNG